MMIVSAAHSFQSVFVGDRIHFFPYLIQVLHQALCDRIGYCIKKSFFRIKIAVKRTGSKSRIPGYFSQWRCLKAIL